jgi:hypothetical protein
MKRALALAVAATFVCASPGFAQSTLPASAPAPAAVTVVGRVDLSARAAGIESMAAARARKGDARAVRAAQGTQGRSFWKSPWPYVIIAGVVTAGVLIASGDGDGIY